MINKQLINLSSPASSGGNAEAEQGLILHLDANDVDSYDGDGTEWVDISTFEKTIPLSDNEVDLDFHIDPTDPNSYSGSGNIITDIAGVATVTKDSGIDYDTDNGGYFDKTNTEDITTNYSPDNLTEFTAEVWVNPNSVTQNVSTVLTVIDSSNSNALLIMYLRADQRQIQFSTYYGGTSFVRWNPTGDTSVQYNKWQHLVMTCKNNGKMVIYLDGEVKQTLDFPHTMNTSVANLEIGHIPSNSTYGFYGKMGAVRFYSKQLSASDIGQNYRHGRDIVYTDLIPDTDLELHLDADSFPEKNETGYSNTPSTWTDSSGNGNNGTISNATFDSELGNWLDFNGSNSVVTVPSSTITPINPTLSFSISLWVRQDDLAGHQTYVAKYGGSTSLQSFIFGLDDSTNKMRLIESTGSGFNIRLSNSTITSNSWTHIVVTSTSSAVKFYINGTLDATITRSQTRVTGGSQDITIGSRPSSVQPFDGQIGQTRIYSSALTQDQVRQNYNFTKNNYPNGYNGTISDATWNPSGYFDFDGFNDKVTIASTATSPIDFTAKNYTIGCWINPDTSGVNQIFTKYGSSDSFRSISVLIDTDNTLRLIQKTSTTDNSYSTSTIPQNTWTHIVIVRSSSDVKFYINGELDNTVSNTFTPNSGGNQSILIGANGTTTPTYFNGQISDVKLYDKALSAAEVTAQFAIKQFDIG